MHSNLFKCFKKNFNDKTLKFSGSCGGPKRRLLTLRKSMLSHVGSRSAMEKVNLKLIDTTSKKGTGRFQTTAEKKAYYGPSKRERTVVVSAGGDKTV